MADYCAGRAKRPVSQVISDSWLQHASTATADASIDAAFEEEYRQSVFRFSAARIQQRVSATTWEAFEATAVQHEPPALVAERLGLSLGNLYVARCRVLKMLRAEVEQVVQEQSGLFEDPQGVTP